MTADERLALVRLKIERANQHIDSLNAAIKGFLDANPYEVGAKHDPETRKLHYYVATAKPVPVLIAAIAGDALHCLRDALDHLAQQLYLVGTGSVKGYRDQTSFPISRTAKDFKATLPRKVEGMRQDAIDAICALEPYQTGKGADLWALHRLNNVDKHRLILTVGSSFRSVDIVPLMVEKIRDTLPELSAAMTNLTFFIKPAERHFPLEAGNILLIAGVDEKPNENVKFTIEVAVHEPGIIEGQAMIETVVQFRNRVDGIVEIFRPFLT